MVVAAVAAEGGDFAAEAEVVFMSLAVLLVTQTDFVRRVRRRRRTGKRIERGGGGGGNGVISSTD